MAYFVSWLLVDMQNLWTLFFYKAISDLEHEYVLERSPVFHYHVLPEKILNTLDLLFL